MHGDMHGNIHTYIHVSIHMYMHTCIYVHMYTYMQTNIHTCITDTGYVIQCYGRHGNHIGELSRLYAVEIYTRIDMIVTRDSTNLFFHDSPDDLKTTHRMCVLAINLPPPNVLIRNILTEFLLGGVRKHTMAAH